MDFSSQIRDNLDCGQVVTVRWVAVSFGVDADQARQMLSDFKSASSNDSRLHATYMISGMLQNKNRAYLVVKESIKDETMSKFASISSCAINSLQRVDTESIAALCEAADTSIAKEQLEDAQSPDFFLRNEFGRIQLEGLAVKPPGQRVEPAAVKQITAQKKESVDEHMARMFSNRTVAPSKPAKPISAANFFGSSTSSKSSSKTLSAIEAPKTIQEAPSTSAVPAPRVKVSKDDDEEEWDDGSMVKVDSKKRKIDSDSQASAVAASDHKENMLMTNDNAEEDMVESEKSSAKPKKVSPPVHGAMDSFVEEVTTADNKGSNGKRTKRKLIEKVKLASTFDRIQ
jgi:hypothetical protein